VAHLELVRGQAGQPDPTTSGGVAQLRRELGRHPVRRWTSGSLDQTVLLVHEAFCRWGSAVLAADLRIGGPEHHFRETRRALRRRGAGRCVEAFVDLVAAGEHPVAAVSESGAPAAARPLVAAVWSLATRGSEAARLGALALGLGCCVLDAVPAFERLDELIRDDPAAEGEADAAARAVLAGRTALYDGALSEIRRRHMALHPSVWRATTSPAPVGLLRS
jgi:hypothetical protein